MKTRILVLPLALALLTAACAAGNASSRRTAAPTASPSRTPAPQATPKERDRDVLGCTLVFVIWPAGFREVAFARCLER